MNAKCDYCDQRATTLAGDTNGVLVCEDHVRLFAEREIAAAIDATQPPAAPETDAGARLSTCEQDHGGHDNPAHVYGHFGSRRTCIRIKATDEWVYDPAWEGAR